MAKKGKKKGTVNGQPYQRQTLLGAECSPEICHEEKLEPSEPALEPEGGKEPTQAVVTRHACRVDWVRVCGSVSQASKVCSFLPLRQMGAVRLTSPAVLSAAQSVFDDRWRRLFPCPWSAVVESTNARVDEEGDANKEETQKQFAERIDNLYRAEKAMADGDHETFVKAAEALGFAHLSMLNMASFGGNANDRSLLHFAAIRCDLAAARWLLRRGASPSVKSRDTDGYGACDTSWTPLHHAARNGDVPMCKLLLAAGADANAQLTDVSAPWKPNEVDALYRSLNVSGKCQYAVGGSTPADIAAKIGNKALAALLCTWPNGAPARARPPCTAPADVTAMWCDNVSNVVAAAVMEESKQLVLRPRHRDCRVPGPLEPDRQA